MIKRKINIEKIKDIVNNKYNFFVKKFLENKYVDNFICKVGRIVTKECNNLESSYNDYLNKSKKIIFITVIFVFGIIILICIDMVNSNLKTKEETSEKNIVEIHQNEFNNEEKQMKIKAKITNGDYNIEKIYNITVPKKEPTDEEVVDRLLQLLNAERIAGDNKSLNKVESSLNLETDNIYGAEIVWESLNGYINVTDGSVIRNVKGMGNIKDTLKVTIKFGDIIKVKEIDVIILENEKTNNEIKLEKNKKELDELIKNNEIYEEYIDNEHSNLKLITKLDESKIEWFEIKENKNKKSEDIKIIILSGIVIYVLVVYNEFRKIKTNDLVGIENLEKEFPNFIEEYILLNKAGYNFIYSLEYLCNKNKEKSLYKELNKILERIKNGEYMYYVLDDFGKKSGSIIIRKFLNNLIANLKRGNKNINIFLKDELKIALTNKKILFQKKAEENVVKSILPLVLILIATIILVVYPAIMALEL